MSRRLRQVGVTAHVACAAGWLGADVAFLALALIGVVSQDVTRVRSAYVAMDVVGSLVIVPFSFAALVSGLLLAWITPWGLVRHYWILAKGVLTGGAVAVLLLHTTAMSEAALRAQGAGTETLSGLRAQLAASGAGGHLHDLPLQLVVAAGAGLLVLLTTTALGVFKPWGRTAYGRRVLSRSGHAHG